MGNMTIHIDSKIFPSVEIENQSIYTVPCKRELVAIVTPSNGSVYVEITGSNDLDGLFGRIRPDGQIGVDFVISTSTYSATISEESTVTLRIGLFESPNSPLNTTETSIIMTVYDSPGGSVIGSRVLTHWSTDYTCLSGPPTDNPT